jgi:NAD(P)-dependent dehydrogenase (short-subunit alcohol dehydrogenase family)
VKSLFPPSRSHLRLAFAIPGILHPEKSPFQIDAQQCLDTFKINTIGPMLIMKHLSPFLPKKKTDMESQTDDDIGLPAHAVWVTMSARVGSTSDNSLGGWYSYRASKAAVNSFTKTFDLYLRNTSNDRAMAVSMHPGTVKTGLSKEFWANVKEEKLFSPEFAAEKLFGVVRSLTIDAGRGRCWDWAGKEILP